MKHWTYKAEWQLGITLLYVFLSMYLSYHFVCKHTIKDPQAPWAMQLYKLWDLTEFRGNLEKLNHPGNEAFK